MALQQKRSGSANDKRNSWSRGKGAYTMRGELQHGSYKRIKSTLKMVNFT